jgi:hypothetical protein
VAVLAVQPTVAQDSWSARVNALEAKYFDRNQKAEAIADLQDAVEKYRNDYTGALCDRMLAILKEYFGHVSNDVNRFNNVVYAMYRGSSDSRINHIVNYFEGQGALYTSARDARRRWYEPHHAELKLTKTQINIDSTTTYTIEAKNDEGYTAHTNEIDVTTEDPTIARVEGRKIRGLRPATTMVIIANNQGIELDKKEIEVLPGRTLSIDPPTYKLTEGDEVQFAVKSNKALADGDLSFAFEPADAAKVKPFPVAPHSNEQHVEVTGLVPSLDIYRLNVQGPENTSTFATISIMMAEPVKPGMKWQLAGSGVVVLSFLWAMTSQSDANEKRDLEDQCVQETFQPCPDEHQAYTDAQTTANIAWTATVLTAAGAGYLWYRYYGNIKLYGRQMDEYKQYSSVNLEINPAGSVAINVRF